MSPGLFLTHLVQVAEVSGVEFAQVCQIFAFLRLGISERPIAVLFDKAQQTISEQLSQKLGIVSDAMAKKYLRRPKNLVKANAIPFIKKIFPDLIALLDGTYHRCEKSEVFIEQLKSFSAHKGYNLVKTLSALTVDGYWWDLLLLSYSMTMITTTR